jgi:hypothetical protein
LADQTLQPQPPESWIKEEVHLKYWIGDKSASTQGTLESVGNHGVTVIAREEVRFFPWHAVLEIAPLSSRRPRAGVMSARY